MKRVASLPMYNVTPLLRDGWNALLADVLARLAPWFGAPGDTLAIAPPAPGEPLAAYWLRDDLLLSQTCGYPLVHALAGRVRVVATPVFDIDGGEHGAYHSVIVAGAHVDATRIADCHGLRAAYNDDDSNSGMNLLRHTVAPFAEGRPFFSSVLKTGAHLASLHALAVERNADVAAIDAVTFAFVREHLPELAALVRVIGRTRSAPGLPLIASNALPDEAIGRIAQALDDAVRDQPALARQLKLRGFARLPASDYGVIGDIEREAIALGYPRLA